jgi:hypothetical protein
MFCIVVKPKLNLNEKTFIVNGYAIVIGIVL